MTRWLDTDEALVRRLIAELGRDPSSLSAEDVSTVSSLADVLDLPPAQRAI
jgi:hypothetical protein